MAGEYSQMMSSVGSQVKSMQFTGQKPSMFLYLGLGCIAFLKDLLDLVGIGSFPGLGTVVTACFAFLIWMLMFLFDRSGGRKNNKVARSLVLLLMSLVEAIGFGLNFLPLETLTVTMLYLMARQAWKKEQKRLAKEGEVQSNAERIREYQMAQMATRMAEATANEPVYQKEQAPMSTRSQVAANDFQYQNKPVKRIS